MILAIEQLKELIKSYTIAQTIADASGSQTDTDKATQLLNTINNLRLQLAINAEMYEVFWNQVVIPLGASANNVYNTWFSKNDKAWLLRRGIAALDAGALVSLLNQGKREKVITRDPVAWQQLFSAIQLVGLGQQTLFDLPETLRFGVNQALNIAVQGEVTGVGVPAKGYIFLHGATLKQNLEETTVKELQSEFINEQGETIYLPETQLVPLIFQFASATAGTYATDANGASDIFTVKNDRSVLITHVSSTFPLCRIDKLSDEARNQTLCERVEMQGVASDYTNTYGTWYELPFPHLLRRGSRFKGVFQQGSVMLNQVEPTATLGYLAFKGITL